MTTSNAPQPQPPVPERDTISTEPLQRRRQLWVMAAVVIGLCLLVPLVFLRRPGASRQPSPEVAEARRQQGMLLKIGASLKEYAAAHDNALPEQLPAGVDAAGATYRSVTQSGARLRHEPFGEHFVAWTEPDAAGRRAVLLNSLDEVEFIADDKLDLAQQVKLDVGALNRVRVVSIEGEEEGEEPTTEPSATAPTTTGKSED